MFCKSGKKIIPALMLLFIIMPVFFKTESYAQEARTVKVGYVNYSGYQEGAEGEHKTGFGYEYLQRVANLNNWNYEYVYGSFSELLEKLSSGEIDLMGDISYTSSRARQFNFSLYPQGKEQYYLTCRSDNADLLSGKIIVLHGKKIGVTVDSYQAGLLKEWLDNNRIDAEIEYFSGSQAILEALDSGSIVAAVMTKVTNAPDYSSIISIGYADFYFGVNKDEPDILTELNSAMYFLQSIDPIFNERISSKYVENTNANLILSESEIEWLKKHPVITIGYVEDYYPFCSSDKYGKASGVMTVIIDQIKELLIFDGEVSFAYRGYPSYTKLEEGLKAGEVDAAFPIMSDLYLSESAGLMETYEVIDSSVALVYAGEYNKNLKTIALSEHSPMQASFVRLFYPDAEIVLVQSAAECLDAVKTGVAQGTPFNVARAQYFFTLPQYSGLRMVQHTGSISYCFSLRKDDSELLKILNRGISAFDSSFVLEHMNDYIISDETYSVRTFVQNHFLLCAVLSITFLMLVFGIIALVMIKIRSDKFAVTDPLTGCYNRKAFDRMYDIKPNNNSIAVIMADLNALKAKNDNEGHEAGDKYICDAADLMKASFGSKNVYRIGGDEFAVVIRGITDNQMQQQIAQMNQVAILLDVSLSVGYEYRESFTDSFADILKVADTKMYEAKNEYYRASGRDRRAR